MREQGLEKWEKHAKQTYDQLVNSSPTKENAILLASAITILTYDKFKEMEYKLMGRDNREGRMQNRMYEDYDKYDRYDRRDY